MCLLELSSVLKGHILSYYPDAGDINHKYLFNCNITPRISNINQNCFRILFCCNEAFDTFFKSAKFQSNCFATLLPTIQKRKKSNPSQTSSTTKKICLKLPKMENLASKFQEGKQSKLEFKPCLKLFFCFIKGFTVCFLKTVSFNSDCSFNFSSGNAASNFDFTIQNNTDNFSGKGKYKNDISTFFSLHFPNDLPNGQKERLMENVFVLESNCCFSNYKETLLLQLVGSVSMAWIFPSHDGAYCLFWVLFCNKLVTRKKKLLHLPYSDWSDAQAWFKQHVNAVSGIHSESMKNYSSFLNEMRHKVVPVNVQVVQKKRTNQEKQQNFTVNHWPSWNC